MTKQDKYRWSQRIGVDHGTIRILLVSALLDCFGENYILALPEKIPQGILHQFLQVLDFAGCIHFEFEGWYDANDAGEAEVMSLPGRVFFTPLPKARFNNWWAASVARTSFASRLEKRAKSKKVLDAARKRLRTDEE